MINNVQILENGEDLVYIPKDFLCEPMYFNQGLTTDSSMKLREQVIEKLLQAKKKLPKGWNFKIWDGYRPLSVQKKLYSGLTRLRRKEHPEWDSTKLKVEVEKFVAYPSYDRLCPSPHNTGGAVDLTIVNDQGEELQMGTLFDEFNEKSYKDYFEMRENYAMEDLRMTEEFQKNRDILDGILRVAGFAPYKWEWWHFSFGDIDWAEYYGKDVAIYGSKEL